MREAVELIVKALALFMVTMVLAPIALLII